MNEGIGSLSYAELHAQLLPFRMVALFLFLVLPAIALLGHRIGRREFFAKGYDRDLPRILPGETSMGAILALLGLMLGFSFSSAINWMEARNRAVVEEAAAISSAFLKADLLDDPGRTVLQTRLLDYSKTRIMPVGRHLTVSQAEDLVAHSLAAQARLWPATMTAIGGETPAPLRSFVAGAVTDVFDAHSRRMAAGAETMPLVTKLVLLLVAAAGVFVVGNRSALQGRPLSWRTFLMAITLALVMITVTDLDRAREGVVTLNQEPIAAAIGDMEAALTGRT
jgi:hypothetical protein